MVARDAKEYPETIPSEIQGGRPLHFLRVLSRIPLLEYPPSIILSRMRAQMRSECRVHTSD